jgi:hypothetical protein
MAIKIGDIVRDCEIPYCLRMQVIKMDNKRIIVRELTTQPFNITYKLNELRFLKKENSNEKDPRRQA